MKKQLTEEQLEKLSGGNANVSEARLRELEDEHHATTQFSCVKMAPYDEKLVTIAEFREQVPEAERKDWHILGPAVIFE